MPTVSISSDTCTDQTKPSDFSPTKSKLSSPPSASKHSYYYYYPLSTEACPQTHPAPPPPPPPDLESPSMPDDRRAAAEMESSPPVVIAKQRARSVAKLVVPAVLCVGIYWSIPPAAAYGAAPRCLYEALAAFVFLGVLASICTILYVIARPGGAAEVEEALKKKAMGVAMAFSLIALALRVLLMLK